ncbi:MAG TPA: alpha/beta hydrolase [Acholeplasmataceae bacterium]|jgi:pimeloyl-ACP methyl ester carboxylesterase|nr:alpha/beta hydrolase [Acholeplasmataceae bacterium]
MIKHVEIINKKGKVLRGYLDHPEGAEKIVVMFHGYTGNKTEHNGHFRSLSRDLSAEKIASLRMDYSCNGESDGEFSEFLFNDALDDALLMLDYAFSKFQNVIVLGFSMGGLIATLLCNKRPISKLLLWSPASDLYTKLRKRFDEANKLDDGSMYIPGFIITESLVESMKGYDPFKEAEKFTNPVMIIHGREDLAVNYLTSVKYGSYFQNANLHLIDKCGHGYDRYHEKVELFSKSLNFIK